MLARRTQSFRRRWVSLSCCGMTRQNKLRSFLCAWSECASKQRKRLTGHGFTSCTLTVLGKNTNFIFEEQTFNNPFNQRSLQVKRLTVWFFKHGALKKCPTVHFRHASYSGSPLRCVKTRRWGGDAVPLRRAFTLSFVFETLELAQYELCFMFVQFQIWYDFKKSFKLPFVFSLKPFFVKIIQDDPFSNCFSSIFFWSIPVSLTTVTLQLFFYFRSPMYFLCHMSF